MPAVKERGPIIDPSWLSPEEPDAEQEAWGKLLLGLDEAIEEKTVKAATTTAYERYPTAVEFGEHVLREHYTPDVEEMMRQTNDVRAVAAQSANATGKTHGAARVAIFDFLKYPESQIFLTAASPESNLRGLLWGQISAVVMRHRHLFPPDRFRVSLPGMRIERKDNPNSFIQGVTIPKEGTAKEREARFSGKHAPRLRFIVDEADAVPPEVFDGIESCMSGGDAHLLALFNPRRQAGHVFQLQRTKRIKTVMLTAFNHPNVVTGRDIIPGAVTREATVRRINIWSRPLLPHETPDTRCFLLPDFLIGETAESDEGTMFPPLPAGYRRVEDPAMSYMVLGQYPTTTEFQLIPVDKITGAAERWKEYRRWNGDRTPRGVRPRCGLDVADLGNDQNCFTARYKSYTAPQIAWGGVDSYFAAEQARGYYLAVDGYAIFIDASGVGSSTPGYMEAMGAHGVNRIMAQASATKSVKQGEFERLRDQGWWEMADWFKDDPNAMIPDEPMLLEELMAATYELTETSMRIKVMSTPKFRELIKRSPDRATSLMLTFCPLTKGGGGSRGKKGSKRYA